MISAMRKIFWTHYLLNLIFCEIVWAASRTHQRAQLSEQASASVEASRETRTNDLAELSQHDEDSKLEGDDLSICLPFQPCLYGVLETSPTLEYRILPQGCQCPMGQFCRYDDREQYERAVVYRCFDARRVAAIPKAVPNFHDSHRRNRKSRRRSDLLRRGTKILD